MKLSKLISTVVLLAVCLPVRGIGMEYVAHRGESYIAPENTLAAINLAWKKNDDAVEIDIHLTKDKKIVVSHDGNTKRCGGVDAVIAQTDSAELRKIDVGSFKGEEYKGERIPFLEEVLAAIPPHKRMLVEIKSSKEMLPLLNEIITKSGKRSQIVIIGFDIETMAASKKLIPDLMTLWLKSPAKDPNTGEWLPYDDEMIKAVKERKLDGFDLNFNGVTKEYLDKVKAAGLKLYVWTVDDAAEAKRLKEIGIESLTTNRADWIREQLKK